MSLFDAFLSPCKRGIDYMRDENYTEAIEFFKELAYKKPGLTDAYINLGRCYFKLRRYAEMKEALLGSLGCTLSKANISDILEMTNWRMLCSYRFFNSWPAFSPDGQHVAYVSARRDTNGDGKINAQDCGGIYVIELDTNRERYIVADDFYNSMPVFSPNGDKLAYLSARKSTDEKAVDQYANPGLYLLDLATGREKMLLDSSYKTKYVSFMPDGKKIVFCCWRPGDQHGGIYSMDLATGIIDAMVPGFHESTFPTVSPLGDKILYSSWRRDTNGDGAIDVRDNSGIYVKSLVTGNEITVSSDEYNNTFPSFSPDGSRVIYLSVRRDTNGDGKLNSLDNSGIYMFDINRKKEKLLLDDTSFNKFVSCAPDGKQAIFISNWREHPNKKEVHDFFENKGIYKINLSSRKVARIVSDKYYGSRSPVMSPNGDFVVYVSWRKDTNRGLYIAYLDDQPSVEELEQWIQDNL